MGRVISGDNGGSAFSGTSYDANNIVAGSALEKDDLVQMASTGKVYPVSNGDIGKVTAMSSAIFAETTVISQRVNHMGWRPAILRLADGCYLIVINYSGTTGCRVRKYSATGTLLATLDLDTTLASSSDFQIVLLSNGSFAIAWSADFPRYAHYAVISSSLTVVKAMQTGNYYTAGSDQFVICPLSAGGFVIAWGDYNTSANYFQVFDNSGNSVLANTQFGTRSTSGGSSSIVAQLSNGNLVLVRTGGTAGDNTKYAIRTIAGAVVKAETQIDTTSVANQGVFICVGTGYFVIYSQTGIRVFDNAGTQQGTTFAGSIGNGSSNKAQILWDGTDFYVIYATAGSSVIQVNVLKLPVTGYANATLYQPYTVSGSASATTANIDAFWTNSGDIGIVTLPYNVDQVPARAVVSKAGAVVFPATGFGTTPGANQGECLKAFEPNIPFGFGCMWEQGATSSTKMMVVKNAETSILGVAQASAAVGDLAQIATAAGVYKVNPLTLSTSPLAFDHTTGTVVPGNKGTMLTNSVILRGI